MDHCPYGRGEVDGWPERQAGTRVRRRGAGGRCRGGRSARFTSRRSPSRPVSSSSRWSSPCSRAGAPSASFSARRHHRVRARPRRGRLGAARPPRSGAAPRARRPARRAIDQPRRQRGARARRAARDDGPGARAVLARAPAPRRAHRQAGGDGRRRRRAADRRLRGCGGPGRPDRPARLRRRFGGRPAREAGHRAGADAGGLRRRGRRGRRVQRSAGGGRLLAGDRGRTRAFGRPDRPADRADLEPRGAAAFGGRPGVQRACPTILRASPSCRSSC